MPHSCDVVRNMISRKGDKSQLGLFSTGFYTNAVEEAVDEACTFSDVVPGGGAGPVIGKAGDGCQRSGHFPTDEAIDEVGTLSPLVPQGHGRFGGGSVWGSFSCIKNDIRDGVAALWWTEMCAEAVHHCHRGCQQDG